MSLSTTERLGETWPGTLLLSHLLGVEKEAMTVAEARIWHGHGPLLPQAWEEEHVHKLARLRSDVWERLNPGLRAALVEIDRRFDTPASVRRAY